MLVDAGGGLRTEEWLAVPIAAVGGLLAGLWRRTKLRARTTGANWWILASAVGWGFSAALTFALVMPGPHVANLAALALGGLMLGAVTGGTLVWVLAPVEAGVESSS